MYGNRLKWGMDLDLTLSLHIVYYSAFTYLPSETQEKETPWLKVTKDARNMSSESITSQITCPLQINTNISTIVKLHIRRLVEDAISQIVLMPRHLRRIYRDMMGNPCWRTEAIIKSQIDGSIN